MEITIFKREIVLMALPITLVLLRNVKMELSILLKETQEICVVLDNIQLEVV